MCTSTVTTQHFHCSPDQTNKGFGPSVPQHTKHKEHTERNESNKFVSAREHLSGSLHAVPSLSARWRHCITYERSGRISSPKLLSGLCGVSNESGRSLAVSVSSRMGDSYYNEGVQTSVCHKAPSFQRSYLFSHGRELRSHSERRNLRSSREGGGASGTTALKQSGVLLPLFPSPEEGRFSPPYSGSQSVEQTSQEIQFQNVEPLLSFKIRKSHCVFYSDRSERCLFPHKHLSSTQKIPSFRLPRRLLRVHSSSFRALTQPEDVLSVCGGRTRSAESSGTQNPDVHRRLADFSRFERGSDTKHCPCARSHHSARLQSEREQEQSHSFAECDFSGAGAELYNNARTALATAHSLSSEMPLAFQRRGEGTVSHMSQTTGSYGFGCPCPAFRPAENEGVHEVGFISSSQPITRSLPLCLGDARLHCSAAPLEECGVLRSWNSPRGNHDAQSCDDRCLLNRVGCHTGGQNSERCVAKHTSLSPHKLFGAPHGLESSESLSAPPARASRAGALRQHHSRGLYQPSRGDALFKAPCSSSQAVSMEQATLPVVTGDSRPRRSEQRSRPSIEGEPTLWGLAPPPSDSGATVEEIRSGDRRSLRLARKRPVPYVLLATGRGRPPRRGRTGPSMAQSASLRISSAIVNSAHSGQGERTEPDAHSDSTQMAQISMAGTDNSSSVCTAVATPATHRPPVSSERGDLPSPPRQGGSMGLARERANLNTLGLPPRVVATIQNARASSTRSLYNCKWRVFEQWCDERQLIAYQCSFTAILSFLQDLIDGGRSFSTIKVYLAAIAACHVGFDGTTVGQHPLIRRFMKGARRSLPVTKKVIPEWDLSMVLGVLSQYPFEPLGDISLKLLSLKTALLLALASAKRVSDLHALSVHSSCTKFSINGDKVFLRPNPAFMPKCFPAFACEVIQLSAFHPPPFSSSEDKRLNALCPVRSLRVYIDRTSAFRRSDQLFISWAPPNTGNPISKQRLSHWLVEAISLAYESKGVRPPEGLRAHSTRGVAASWALFNGVSLQDICAAASWASPHTFVRYYRLDVTQTPVAHSVLGVGSSLGCALGPLTP
ncbi:uncharacterized protein [Garra rufa]|uniref:uncharacterized protein n=1 Tax=Garra rufa TaxID=137080 RepID=UPI003CCE9D22